MPERVSSLSNGVPTGSGEYKVATGYGLPAPAQGGRADGEYQQHESGPKQHRETPPFRKKPGTSPKVVLPTGGCSAPGRPGSANGWLSGKWLS